MWKCHRSQIQTQSKDIIHKAHFFMVSRPLEVKIGHNSMLAVVMSSICLLGKSNIQSNARSIENDTSMQKQRDSIYDAIYGLLVMHIGNDQKFKN